MNRGLNGVSDSFKLIFLKSESGGRYWDKCVKFLG